MREFTRVLLHFCNKKIERRRRGKTHIGHRNNNNNDERKITNCKQIPPFKINSTARHISPRYRQFTAEDRTGTLWLCAECWRRPMTMTTTSSKWVSRAIEKKINAKLNANQKNGRVYCTSGEMSVCVCALAAAVSWHKWNPNKAHNIGIAVAAVCEWLSLSVCLRVWVGVLSVNIEVKKMMIVTTWSTMGTATQANRKVNCN